MVTLMAIIMTLFVCFEDIFGYHGNQATTRIFLACYLIEPFECINPIPHLSFYSIYLERYSQKSNDSKLALPVVNYFLSANGIL